MSIVAAMLLKLHSHFERREAKRASKTVSKAAFTLNYRAAPSESEVRRSDAARYVSFTLDASLHHILEDLVWPG